MLSNDESKNPFQDLLDSISNKTIKRAGKATDWNDVWISLLKSPTYNKVLQERGVDIYGLRHEIEFLAEFPDFLPQSDYSEENLKLQERALLELKNEIGNVQSFQKTEKNAEEKITDLKAVFELIEDYLDRIQAVNDTPDKTRKKHMQDIQTRSLKRNMITYFMDILGASVLKEKIIDNVLAASGVDTEELGVIRLDSKTENTVFDFITKEIEYYLSAGYEIKFEDIVNPLSVLKKLSQHPQLPPAASDVVDTVIRKSGDLFTKLLHRHGLPSTDVRYVDPLADLLPEPEIQNIILNAYSYAKSLNAKYLTPRHVARVLAQRSEIHVHFSNIGLKDLSEFTDKVTDLTEKAEGTRDKNIHMRTQVFFSAHTLIRTLSDIYKKEESYVPVLLSLIKDEQDVDKIFNKAGLTRAMLKDWPKKYEEEKKAEQKNKKPKKKKDNEEEFDIFSMLGISPRKSGDGPYEIADEYLESLIKKYCIDYTKLAKQKKFDPMIGNEAAMQEVVTILQKRGKKNPILIGEPGVGKSKILEGLAQRIVKGNIPKQFIGARLLMLDLSVMNDTPYRGIFEERANSILKGVSERNAHKKLPPILLGLEEFGENMEAGGHAHSSGFKGLVKPYLTSGDLFVIANTTEEEWNRKIEKDSALARRLQPVLLSEPTVEQAANILLGQKTKYSGHHKIRIPNDLIPYVAEMAGRYVQTVKQPDKSLDILDLACAMARTQGAKTLQKEHIQMAISSKSGIPVSFLNQNDRERYAAIERHLGRQVFDQQEAVEKVSAALKRARAGLRDPEAPIGNFLFVGPTGVGKTELARAISRFLFSSEKFLNRYNMGEYMEKHSVSGMIGAPPGYVGFDQGSPLVDAVRRRPFCVNLFDEAEKADPSIYGALLAPMSNGGMNDKAGKSADFSNTVNILTVNLGAQEVMETGRRRGLDPLKDYDEWNAMAQPI